MAETSERLWSALVSRDEKAEAKLPEEVRRNVPTNGLRLVGATALQSSGDQTVNASTVLPWLFHALGVPPALTGLLVPIRESGSMLPQALLTPLVMRVRRRRFVFVAGAAVQAIAVAVMAATAALGQGLPAGIVVLLALAVFSLGRCLCSISSKDVMGRTMPKGERGQVNGLSTTAAGLVAITLGLAIRLLGDGSPSADQLAWLLGAGALLWVGVAAVYATVREPEADPEESAARGKGGDDDAAGSAEGERDGGRPPGGWTLLREDRLFRHFVTARSLLLVSSLSPPFVVTLSIAAGTDALGGLGSFVLASGVASLIGGRIFGRAADRSSRRLMAFGAGFASLAVLVLVGLVWSGVLDGNAAASGVVFVIGYFLLTLVHTGVRVGRKTYLVDMASGDRRTVYTAVSNTTLGVVLLVFGAISSALATVDVTWALLFLAVTGLLGVWVSSRLPEA